MPSCAVMRRTWALLIALGMPLACGCIADSLEPDVGELRAGLCKPEDSSSTFKPCPIFGASRAGTPIMSLHISLRPSS